MVGLVFTGMQALQHRGQTGAGIAVFDGDTHFIEKNNGLVTEALSNDDLHRLAYIATTATAIGHDRYSTSGKIDKKQSARLAQPFGAKSGRFALAHNGHIEDIGEVAKAMGIDVEGCESDSECLTFMIDEVLSVTGDLVKALHVVLPKLDGAVNLVINEPNRLIAVRDPRGYRPLSVGTLSGGGYIVASETVALDVVGARLDKKENPDQNREVKPGEIIIIDQDGMRSEMLDKQVRESKCLIETFYFMHPNSETEAGDVYTTREKLGRLLGKYYPIDADTVIGLQNSGAPYARGYSHQTGVPEDMAITKNQYINRTFIADGQITREELVAQKHLPIRSLVENKSLIIVDDSIVRGTTQRGVIRALRTMGAREIHLRIPLPPYAWPCYYGMDTKDVNELLAHGKTIPQMAEELGADSLEHLTLEQVFEVLEPDNDSVRLGNFGRYCVSCITGEYPTPVPVTMKKEREKLLEVSLSR
jgi:amidophosphoribosyltransferase